MGLDHVVGKLAGIVGKAGVVGAAVGDGRGYFPKVWDALYAIPEFVGNIPAIIGGPDSAYNGVLANAQANFNERPLETVAAAATVYLASRVLQSNLRKYHTYRIGEHLIATFRLDRYQFEDFFDGAQPTSSHRFNGVYEDQPTRWHYSLSRGDLSRMYMAEDGYHILGSMVGTATVKDSRGTILLDIPGFRKMGIDPYAEMEELVKAVNQRLKR